MIRKYPSHNVAKRVTREPRATREKRVILNAHETSPIVNSYEMRYFVTYCVKYYDLRHYYDMRLYTELGEIHGAVGRNLSLGGQT